jgi:hypothetical protein
LSGIFKGTNFMTTATMIVHLRRPPTATVIGLVAGTAIAIWVWAKNAPPDHGPHIEMQQTSPQLDFSNTTSATVSVR